MLRLKMLKIWNLHDERIADESDAVDEKGSQQDANFSYFRDDKIRYVKKWQSYQRAQGNRKPWNGNRNDKNSHVSSLRGALPNK